MKFGLLECPEIWICEMQAMTESIGTGTMARCVTKPCHFLGVFNACANIVALEKGRHAHEQIIQSGCESDVIRGIGLWTCLPNVGALRMLGECLTIWPCQMWSLGKPCLEDLHGKEALEHFEHV
jgi:hypothetical protein